MRDRKTSGMEFNINEIFNLTAQTVVVHRVITISIKQEERKLKQGLIQRVVVKKWFQIHQLGLPMVIIIWQITLEEEWLDKLLKETHHLNQHRIIKEGALNQLVDKVPLKVNLLSKSSNLTGWSKIALKKSALCLLKNFKTKQINLKYWRSLIKTLEKFLSFISNTYALKWSQVEK